MNSASHPAITILLASYNGAEYISDQLESIISQTYQNWELLIRDDGSTDSTGTIIQKYCALDKRIRLIKDNKGNLRSSQNFSALMSHCPDADYIMFADQDDLWESTKIEVSIKHLLQNEVIVGKSMPILVYTNFQYVDQDLNEIDQNSRSEVPLSENEEYLPRLLAQNWIYGCTTIINKALCSRAYPIPLEAENHDYWISLVAASYGKIFHLPLVTVKYRQHSANVSGTFKDSSLKNRFARIRQLRNPPVNLISRRLSLFGMLLKRDDLQRERHDLVKSYIEKCSKGGLACIWFCYRNKITKRGFFQTAIYYLQLF